MTVINKEQLHQKIRNNSAIINSRDQIRQNYVKILKHQKNIHFKAKKIILSHLKQYFKKVLFFSFRYDLDYTHLNIKKWEREEIEEEEVIDNPSRYIEDLSNLHGYIFEFYRIESMGEIEKTPRFCKIYKYNKKSQKLEFMEELHLAI